MLDLTNPDSLFKLLGVSITVVDSLIQGNHMFIRITLPPNTSTEKLNEIITILGFAGRDISLTAQNDVVMAVIKVKLTQ